MTPTESQKNPAALWKLLLQIWADRASQYKEVKNSSPSEKKLFTGMGLIVKIRSRTEAAT
jgi:hypothetical protein